MKPYQLNKNEQAALEAIPMPLGVFQFVDQRVVTLALSAGFCRLFEFDSHEEAYEVMSKNMYSSAHPDDAARMAETAYRFATGQSGYELVFRLRRRKSHTYRILHAMGEHVYTLHGTRLAYIWFTDEGEYAGADEDDISTAALQDAYRKALHKESLLRVSYFDDLTGLPNAPYFFSLAEEGRRAILEAGGRFAVVYTNLRGMKLFNNRYGYVAGDELIRDYSRILVRHFGHDNCARFGQDHFAVYAKAEGLDETLTGVINEYLTLKEAKTVPLKIGVFLDETGTADIATGCDMASYACDALHGPKSAFRYYDGSLLQDTANRQWVIDNLDAALEERRIEVHFQPIIRAVNGRICSEEALARWNDPEKGMLSPASFIPALEDAGLLYKLDLYVVDCILEKMQRTRASGMYILPISVNLSRSDFDACDMVAEICRRVDTAGFSRSKLIIEVTESAVGKDFEFMKKQIETFREFGFPVWMDDFGSGYSSLDMLQSIRFDLLKFDMRFMQEFGEHEENKIILTGLIKMAIGLELDTLMEGVEREEQVQFLRQIGCGRLQGFYFGRPKSVEAIFSNRDRSKLPFPVENPDEAEYYASVGSIDLYDLEAVAHGGTETLEHYFDTLPMAVIETTETEHMILRCNQAYQDFMEETFGAFRLGQRGDIAAPASRRGLSFLNTLHQCGRDGIRRIQDEEMPNGSLIHAVIRRIAVNPVTGTAAIAVAVLDVTSAEKRAEVTYSEIAKALADDFICFYLVDPETGHYAEYRPSEDYEGLQVPKRGTDFFADSIAESARVIPPEDHEMLHRRLTKENVLREIDRNGLFLMRYHLIIGGKTYNARLKGVLNGESEQTQLIFGVTVLSEGTAKMLDGGGKEAAQS